MLLPRTFPSSSLTQLYQRSLSAWQSSIVFAVVDSAIYGNVKLMLLFLLLFPVLRVIFTPVISITRMSRLFPNILLISLFILLLLLRGSSKYDIHY